MMHAGARGLKQFQFYMRWLDRLQFLMRAIHLRSVQFTAQDSSEIRCLALADLLTEHDDGHASGNEWR